MIWVPDLYIRQLREMRVLSLFEEISSLRLYRNSTISLSIGATIIIKCDMDFVLYPLDVQKCFVDFSSCKWMCSMDFMRDIYYRNNNVCSSLVLWLIPILYVSLPHQTSTTRMTWCSGGETRRR